MFQQSATTKACYELLRSVNGEISYATICAKLKLPRHSATLRDAPHRNATQRKDK